jgi:hypothetical protein
MSAGDGAPAVISQELLRELWQAFGCEINPNDFHESVRAQMWQQILEMARAAAQRNGRIYRENVELQNEVYRLQIQAGERR